MTLSRVLTIIGLIAFVGTASAQPVSYKQAKGANYHTYAKNKWPAGVTEKKHASDSGEHAVTSLYVDRRAKKWSLGAGTGLTFFFGDADKIQPSWHARVFGKYSISQTFGIKGEWNIGQLKGARDFQFPTNFKDNFAFKSQFQDFNVQMVFTLGNISFLRPLRKTQMNLFIGGGWASFRSVANFVDERLYVGGDYYLDHYLGKGSPNPNLHKAVTETYDGRHWIVPFGFGIKHNLGRYFDIGVEYRQTYLRNDDIDVYNTEIWQNRWFDQYSMLNVNGAWKLGNKNTQHYDWLSPVESIYDKVAIIEEKLDSLSTDADKDGVADFWDDEANTPDSCHVYGNGVSVDTDGDGVPDCQDAEISDKGAVVGPDGKMLDSDGDGVPDVRDLEPNSPMNAMVDVKGRTIKSNCCNCEDMTFPALTFNTGKCNMGPEATIALTMILDKMKQCPDKKLVICAAQKDGKNKVGGKGDAAANCRTEGIINYLVRAGISRDRIVVDQNCASGDANKIDFKFSGSASSSNSATPGPRSSR